MHVPGTIPSGSTLLEVKEGTVARSGNAEAPPNLSELWLRQVAEVLDAIFWVVRPPTFATVYVSPAYERLTGLTCASAYENPPSWITAVERSQLPQLMDMLRAASEGRAGQVEFQITHPDGSVRWVRSRGFPIRDAAGVVTQVGGVAEDVTEQKDSQTRMSRLAEMLDRASDAVVLRDYDGMAVRFWNKGAEQLYQYSATDVMGRDFTDLIETIDFNFEEVRQALLDRGEWRGDLTLRRPDQSVIIVNACSTLRRDAAGKPESILHIAKDITEQRLAERRLLRSQRIENIGTLASGVAHDLTNILSPIILSTHLLATDITPAEKRKMIDTVTSCARRGMELVQQVLSFARGVEGKRMLINLEHVLNELRAMVERTFPRGITFSANWAENLWPIAGDPTQLQQVLLNLSINARDAMPKGGTLSISAENFVVDESFASGLPEVPLGGYVVLSVTDTGTGISRELRDRIFEPFFTTKRVGEGTGLGLSTTLSIVKSHGGFITVESEENLGTQFKVFLPASPGEGGSPAQPEGETSAPLCGDGELILIADDDEAFRNVVGAALRKFGYRVVLAGDGTSAIAKFMEHRGEIKLLFTDTIMPYLDGVALVRALRQIEPGLKVLGVSGNTNDPRTTELRSMNLHGFLFKPFDGAALSAAVYRALHREP